MEKKTQSQQQKVQQTKQKLKFSDDKMLDLKLQNMKAKTEETKKFMLRRANFLKENKKNNNNQNYSKSSEINASKKTKNRNLFNKIFVVFFSLAKQNKMLLGVFLLLGVSALVVRSFNYPLWLYSLQKYENWHIDYYQPKNFALNKRNVLKLLKTTPIGENSLDIKKQTFQNLLNKINDYSPKEAQQMKFGQDNNLPFGIMPEYMHQTSFGYWMTAYSLRDSFGAKLDFAKCYIVRMQPPVLKYFGQSFKVGIRLIAKQYQTTTFWFYGQKFSEAERDNKLNLINNGLARPPNVDRFNAPLSLTFNLLTFDRFFDYESRPFLYLKNLDVNFSNLLKINIIKNNKIQFYQILNDRKRFFGGLVKANLKEVNRSLNYYFSNFYNNKFAFVSTDILEENKKNYRKWYYQVKKIIEEKAEQDLYLSFVVLFENFIPGKKLLSSDIKYSSASNVKEITRVLEQIMITPTDNCREYKSK